MSNNLVKFYNTAPQEESKLIDSNTLVEQKLKEVATKARKKSEEFRSRQQFSANRCFGHAPDTESSFRSCS